MTNSEATELAHYSDSTTHHGLAYKDHEGNWALTDQIYNEQQARDALTRAQHLAPSIDWRAVQVTKTITVTEVPE